MDKILQEAQREIPGISWTLIVDRVRGYVTPGFANIKPTGDVTWDGIHFCSIEEFKRMLELRVIAYNKALNSPTMEDKESK